MQVKGSANIRDDQSNWSSIEFVTYFILDHLYILALLC